jgi:hypothetical protein
MGFDKRRIVCDQLNALPESTCVSWGFERRPARRQRLYYSEFEWERVWLSLSKNVSRRP